jgi:pectinesterase
MSTGKVTGIAAVVILLLVSTTAGSKDTGPIPGEPSSLNSWFHANVKSYTQRNGTLDPALETAEAKPKTIRVRKDGSGDFKTLTGAVRSISSGNTQRVIVDIGSGVYNEKIQIEKEKPFVTFKGSASSMPTLTFAGTARVYGTVYSATLQVDSDYFVASNIIIKVRITQHNVAHISLFIFFYLRLMFSVMS